MLKTVQTILTTEGDRRSNRKESSCAAHFINGYIKRERKNQRKRNKENDCDSVSNHAVLMYNLLYKPRILKNDLRRQYPIIFANVYNTCDCNLMFKFFQQFCDVKTGIVTLSDTYPVKGLPCTLTASIQGAENYGRAWTFRMGDIPDLHFQVHSIQIRVRSDGTSVCQSKYSFSGTTIIFVDPKRISKILKYYKINDHNGATVNIKQMNIDSQKKTKKNDHNDAVDELFIIDELKELFDNDHDRELLNELIHDHPDNANNHRREESSSSFFEEKEYLLSVFTDEMNPSRVSPRIPDVTETFPLQVYCEYKGDATFHVNDESKIYRLDLRANLAIN